MKRHALTAAVLSSALMGAVSISTPAMAQDQQYITIGRQHGGPTHGQHDRRKNDRDRCSHF